jgi:DNA-binding response OmpR family regulator
MSTPRILIVEDEAHLAQGLLFNLQADGYGAELAPDGETALARLLTPPPQALPIDLLLLDVMLPEKSGFDVVRELREASNFLPVLMLTARSRPEDILEGLEAGADDYLPKPFDLSILLARLRVLFRRLRWQRPELAAEPAADSEKPSTYSFAGRTIDFAELEVRREGAPSTRLTLMEAEFLRYLSENPHRILPRSELLEQVWRVREDTDTRAIDNFVVRLRRYLEDSPGSPVYLKTVRGVGYRFLPGGE